jgi:hypothetical protein
LRHSPSGVSPYVKSTDDEVSSIRFNSAPDLRFQSANIPTQPISSHIPRRSRASQLVSSGNSATHPPIALKSKRALRRSATVPIAPLTASGLYGNLTLVLDPKTSAPIRTTPPPPKRLLHQVPIPQTPVPKMLLRNVSLDKALPAEDEVGRITRHGNLVWTAPSVRAQYRAAHTLKKKDDNNSMATERDQT